MTSKFDIKKQIAELSVQEKLAEREKLSKPVTNDFFEWGGHTLEKLILLKKLKEALIYAKDQKEGLSAFSLEEHFLLSNRLAERIRRPFVVHPKLAIYRFTRWNKIKRSLLIFHRACKTY